MNRNSIWKIICLVVVLLATIPLALSRSVSGWAFGEAPPWSGQSGNGHFYHPVAEGHFAEAWVAVISQRSGGHLLLLSTLFHFGPLRFSQGLAAFVYQPDGTRLFGSASYRGKDTFDGQTSPFHIQMDGNKWSGNYPDFALHFDNDEIGGDIVLAEAAPPIVPGTGQVDLGDAGLFGITHMVPWAKVTGQLVVAGTPVDVDGFAYLENVYGAPIPPDYSERWELLRFLGEEYALTLVDITLKPEVGGGHLRSMVLSKKQEILLSTQAFELSSDAKLREEEPSPPKMGTGYHFKSASHLGPKIEGDVKVKRVLESLDILGELPFFIRLLAGSLYGRPYHHRYEAEVDFLVTDGDMSIRIKGLGFGERHSYEP